MVFQNQWENMTEIRQMKKLKKKNDRDAVGTEDDDCYGQIIEYLKRYKTEPKWVKMKSAPRILEFELKIFAHNGPCFDCWILLNTPPNWCRVINPIKTAKSLITEKL